MKTKFDDTKFQLVAKSLKMLDDAKIATTKEDKTIQVCIQATIKNGGISDVLTSSTEKFTNMQNFIDNGIDIK